MSQQDESTKSLRSVLVWDVPTRVFHWLLALSFAGAYLTTESERYRDIHVVLGYTMLGLIAFRLLWGFFGTRYAQFHSFLFKPGEIVADMSLLLKDKPAHHVGHNPAGSVSIWLMLLLGISCGATGVLLLQNIGGEAMEELHEFTSNAMLAMVLIHIAGVVLSSVLHRENLVRSMVTGYKTAKLEQAIRRPHLWLGVIMLAVVVAFWVGYPSTGLVTPGANATHTEQHDDD